MVILVVTGETSGEQHAAGLIDEVNRQCPDLSVDWFGSGGERMSEAGVDLLADVSRLAAIGPWDALSLLPDYLKLYRRILKETRSRAPRLAILVDFPEFNLKLARRLKKMGVFVCYFIGPQVWAWRSSRVRQIGRCVDLMLVILPFEQDFYERRQVSARYVGNPSVSRLTRFQPREVVPRPVESGAPFLVALFPGSRMHEVQRILPVQLDAALHIQAHCQVRFWVAQAPGVSGRQLLGIYDSWRRKTKTLVLDTRHFSADFTDRLLASFDDLDGMTDGLLVHSENWQALRLLEERYRGSVRCIYIDPPFNTNTDDFVYKDGYPHSSWLTMMESRLQLGRQFLTSDGTLYAHIDYTEKELLKGLLDKYLTYVTEIIWRIGWISGYKSAAKKFIRNHDTIYQYGKTESPMFNKTYIAYPDGYTRRDGSPPSGEGYPLEDTWNSSDLDKLHSIQIMSFSREKVGNQALTQKNEGLVSRMVTASSNPDDVVLDYFLGSGTTTAVAHKMRRRYIGVEMGDQFFTYSLPRMKRVLQGETYGISASFNWQGGGMFKYMRIESYEDALDGIEFDQATGQMHLEERLGDGYLLKYMLKWETKHSQTLLNVTDLDSPFDYRLRSHANGADRERLADVPETFNYLLGLNVRTRHVYHDDDRRYLVYRGETREAPGRETVVIWRNARGWSDQDHERDRQFVADQGLVPNGATVFVNQPSSIAGAKPVEPLFHARMFAGVNG